MQISRRSKAPRPTTTIPRDANTKGDDDDSSYAGLPRNLHLRIVSPCRPPMSSILQQNLRISDGNEPTSQDRDSSAEKSLSVSDQNIRRDLRRGTRRTNDLIIRRWLRCDLFGSGLIGLLMD
ncbi:hypothetical protein GBA52_018292 [Prunus armeniaca]|nr:hypothetical protein GBA52_018292 [Prunus armeniaca]